MNKQPSNKHTETFARQFHIACPSVELKESVLNLAKTHWSQSPAQHQLGALGSYLSGLAAIWLGILAIHSAGYVLNETSPNWVTIQTSQQHEADLTMEFGLPNVSPIALCSVKVNPNRSYSHVNQLNTWLRQGGSP